MDPVSLIVGALTSGAAKGMADSASDSVKDAYGKLIGLISRRFTGNKAAEVALAEHAADPQTWQAPLTKALTESGVGADLSIIEAASQLMALLDQAGARSGKYHVDLRGSQGVQIGDHGQQVNVFTDRPQSP